MAENSKIEWTDHTFNPWMGCTKVSPACKNCYAERDMDHRYGKVQWGPNGTRVKTSVDNWRKPLRWNRDAQEKGVRYRVFCASLADVFEDWDGPMLTHTGEQYELTMAGVRRELFQLIDNTPNLDWLLLTKRPENITELWVGGTRSNVWLGTSIENQEWADKRLPHLHHVKRQGFVNTTFVSAEPLVGPIMLKGEQDGLTYNHLGRMGIDWVITGGESGPDARPCKPEWFQSLRDQCVAAGTAFHFKQWGEFDAEEKRVGKKNAGRLLDGRTHDGLPIVAVGGLKSISHKMAEIDKQHLLIRPMWPIL